jgi:hypothetical protein
MQKPEYKFIKDCPMRHANGNCLPVGGFCTSVKAAICDAARKGYESGYHAARMREVSNDVYPGTTSAPRWKEAAHGE